MHLLSCPACGKQQRVEVKQAGQMLTCACGANVQVPTLRELKALPLANASATQAAPRSSWSGTQALLFGLGLLMCLLGLGGVAAGLYLVRGVPAVERPSAELTAAEAAAIDGLPPTDVQGLWEQVSAQPEFEYRLPHWKAHNELRAHYIWYAKVSAAAVAIGFVGMLTSLFLGRAGEINVK